MRCPAIMKFMSDARNRASGTDEDAEYAAQSDENAIAAPMHTMRFITDLLLVLDDYLLKKALQHGVNVLTLFAEIGFVCFEFVRELHPISPGI